MLNRDFDYSGSVDYHDYALIDAGYNYFSGTSDFMIAHYSTYGEDDKIEALAP